MTPVSEPAPGVRGVRADNPGPMTLDGTRSYLVGTREAVLLDPGPDDADAGRRWRELAGGAEVRLVVLTHAHPDHAAGAERAGGLFGASVAASERTLGRLEVDGRPLRDGDELPVDGGDASLRVLETPGHSDDHLCFLRPTGRVLFTGDLVLGEGSSLVGHPEGSVADYLASLDRLIAEEPRLILPGHGPDVPDARERLRAYRDHREERTVQVREALRAGARSVEAIRREVYGDLEAGLGWAADATIRAHLEHLEELGEEVPEVSGREGAWPPGGEGPH